jgi:spore germination protein PC
MQRICNLEFKVQQLTEQLASQQRQLDDLKGKPPVHVEYHFDQLKVNRLEGTLNVGITPQGIQGIESFEAPDPSCWKVTNDTPDATLVPLQQLQGEMANYMDTESRALLMELEKQYSVTLDDAHRRRITDDVKHQLNERVHYYARKEAYPANGSEEEQLKWRDSIRQKTIHDIQGAFSAYLSKQQKQEQAEQRRSKP